MATNSTLPQGFSVFQPTLGAQLQFFPAIGTRELDELVNAFIPGPASLQEKRASITLDFFEYAHLTGQTFKFYPVYTLSTPVESPATASPLQDSGYGSSFNASPVMSNWDWSQVNAAPSSRRSSPKSTSSHQPADFSNLPGMKIMTKDGRDVTNSASRGSKTKEQRDHAHLMRIIKACDSCKKKKIRCDPSHKKRGVSSTPAQPAKVIKKTKTVAPEAKVAPVVVQDATAAQLAFLEQDFSADLDSLAASVEPGNEWEQFIQYPVVDDSYDFFNDPEGYFSPQSSSSEFSAKPATPETDLRRRRGATNTEIADLAVPATYLPFNQTEGIHDYVDFNLYSPESSFSEDERMVPIEVSKQSVSLPRSPAPNPLPPNESFGGSDSSGGDLYGGELTVGELTGDLFESQSAASHSATQQLFTHGQLHREVYRDPGAGLEYYSSPSSIDLGSDLLSTSVRSHQDSSGFISDAQSSSVDTTLSTNTNATIRRGIIETRGVTTPTTQAVCQQIETTVAATQPESRDSENHNVTTLPGSRSIVTTVATTQSDSHLENTIAMAQPGSQQPENHNVTTQLGSQSPQSAVAVATTQSGSLDAEIHNVAGDTSPQQSPSPVAIAPVAIGLASMYRQPSMGVLAPIAAMLIALTVWSYISDQFATKGRSSEKQKLSPAKPQGISHRLISGIAGNVDGLQSKTLSGKKSVGRMVSMSRSLIAV
ncbi:hypothetical protein NW762_007496 [Fusarium torreyae]|uniref:Zn(2)-C6 fungal-type domain-containing protein n=1 Tax=Fusarium torreyae TaxID=1237075 RepID=A0A9W8S0X7_9HYPO|nr:hypothetical protein NW762_007496 [Fusarium torreyae]